MNSVLIREIPKEERPRERLIKYGAESLSTEDLLAIILKTGTRDFSSKYLATEILKLVNDVTELSNITIGKLININGIGAVKAVELLAALELGKRVFESKPLENNLKLNSAKKIFDYFCAELKNKKQEYFYCIYLNQNKKLIDKKLLFKGTLNKSLVHPREIFKAAYLCSAASIICVHNHPSGDTIPSKEDLNLTKALVEIGKMQGINIIDHIIIGKNYYSLYQNGDM